MPGENEGTAVAMNKSSTALRCRIIFEWYIVWSVINWMPRVIAFPFVGVSNHASDGLAKEGKER